jgi:hypothetical protein
MQAPFTSVIGRARCPLPRPTFGTVEASLAGPATKNMIRISAATNKGRSGYDVINTA